MSSRRNPGPNSYPVIQSIDESELANFNRNNRQFPRTPSRGIHPRSFDHDSSNNFVRRNNGHYGGVNFQNRSNNGHHHHLPKKSDPRNIKADIISNFHCPFLEENSCMYASDPLKCFYAHPETTSASQNLRSLPQYACPFFLINRCYHSDYLKCTNGLHLFPKELLDLENFERKNESKIINYYSRFAHEDQHECNICYDIVMRKRLNSSRYYAILENCDHIFCRICIVKVRRNSLACPVCRVESTRWIPRKNLTLDDQQKKNLFKFSPHVIEDEPINDMKNNGPLYIVEADRVLYVDYDEEEEDYPLQPLTIWNEMDVD